MIEAIANINSPQLTIKNARRRTEQFITKIPTYSGDYSGRGIIICGGGAKYFPGTWVTIRMLRQLGCELPIEVWYLGASEMSPEMCVLLAPYNVICINACAVRDIHPYRILNGWELKAYSIVHSSFREVMLLDADNVPVTDPTYLFDASQYQQYGAVFWPDIYRKPGENSFKNCIWEMLGMMPPFGIPEFESAQLIINKEKCWRPLCLALWINEHSDFFYRYVHGDKDTFHLAWRKLGVPFGMPAVHVHHLRHTLCQNDFAGQRVFQHRCTAKWGLTENLPEEGFWLESDCLIHLAELATLWDGRVTPVPRLDFGSFAPESLQQAVQTLTTREHLYRRVGHDERLLTFIKNGKVGKGAAHFERFWDVCLGQTSGLSLYLSSPERLTCELLLAPDGVWRGCWQHSGEMLIELQPL